MQLDKRVIERLHSMDVFDPAFSIVHCLDRRNEGRNGSRRDRLPHQAPGTRLMGDVASIGEGVSEVRIHVGAGWRMYFTTRAGQIIVLLTGGSKRTQTKDIKRPRHSRLCWTEGDKIMSKRTKVTDLPEFNAAQYLNSETSIAAYLTNILGANDAALLASALGDIARARGMSEIAKSAGLTREALYKALRPDSSPRFDTVSRVCAALGVRLVAETIHPAPHAAGAVSGGRP